MKYLALLAVAVFGLTPVISEARAQAGGDEFAARLAQADSNHDGMITRAELLTWRMAQFDRFDRNHDGVLSDSDMPRFASARDRLDEARAAFDANGDGRVSRREFSDGPTPAFDQIDRDHNGVVDGRELALAKGAY